MYSFQIELILKCMHTKCILFKINVHNHKRALSLIDTVPVYVLDRPGSLQPANRDESGKNSSAFIYSRQCYGPDPVWGKNLSRSVPVMLRSATVHYHCSATVCPGTSRCIPIHHGFARESATEPRCHYGESRK